MSTIRTVARPTIGCTRGAARDLQDQFLLGPVAKRIGSFRPEGITTRRDMAVGGNVLVASVIPILIQPVHPPGVLIFGRIYITGNRQMKAERGNRRRQFNAFGKVDWQAEKSGCPCQRRTG
jgi:hypothetical protein